MNNMESTIHELKPTNMVAIVVPEEYSSERVFVLWDGNSWVIEVQNKTNTTIQTNIKCDELYFLGSVTTNGKITIEFDVEPYVEYHQYPSFRAYRDYMFLHGTSDYEKEHLYDFMEYRDSFISLLMSNGVEVSRDEKLFIFIKK